MKQALYQFTKESLASASRGLLNKLGIKYQKSSDTPMPKDAILNKLNASQSIHEAFEIITNIYFIGLVDDRTFNNISDSIDYESAIRDAGGDKYKGMLCFACEINDDAKVKRTTYAIITRAFNKLANNKPVVLITRQGDKLGISTCERIDKKREAGEKMGKVNLLQNINCAAPHTGHIRILESLQVGTQIKTFDALYKHWFDAFNTKTLTDRFYEELYNWYMWVVNDPNTHFPENSHLPEHENEKKNVKIIRLITRLLFVWFIKEKRVKRECLPDIGLVPDNLFDTKELEKILNDFDPNSANDGEYYNAILQNLFFATLNNEVKSRKFIDTSNFYRSKKGYTVKNLYRDNKGEGKSWFKISHDEVINLFKTVPFLNCGLFECLDKYKRTDISYDVDRFFDGFSTKSEDKYRACLPNRLFFGGNDKGELPEITVDVMEGGKTKSVKIKSKGLINLLNEYVFTVEENTPLEQQVSLDPELLGKVFENLLAAYNPETKDKVGESTRKGTGSYYTPREIVEYMVNESLIQYLKTKLDAEDETKKQLRNLVSPSNLDFNFSDNQQDTILEALYHCRILDPACGSGAFPMGMLQQMVHIISRLDEHNEKWKKLITQKATDETTKAFENKELTDEERKAVIAEITNTFTNNKNNPDYTRKLYLIQNCIFGVDIQPIAMMISKLRFFISLICEQDENAINFNDENNNFGIHTLPNLETKFVAANSLLTPDVRKFTGDWTNDEHLDKLKDELMELRYRHVTARSMKEKMKIRTLDDEKRQEINEYILSTQAHADATKIAMCQDQIAHLMLERKLYEGENIVEEYVDTQADLFAETTRELVRKDINRTKRDEIDRQIHICQAQIECEKAKENISGFAAAVKQLTEWNPYDQVKSSPFFDPDWMFGIAEGFDIVIGNPPYINIANIKDNEYRELLKREFVVTKNKCDMYAYFIEHSFKIMSIKGILAFIIPETWKATDSFSKLRDLIVNYHSIMQIVNLKMGVFDAVVHPMIAIFENIYKKDYSFPVYDGLTKMKYYISDSDIVNTSDLKIDTESTIEEKNLFSVIEKATKRLGTIVEFSRGVKTSDDKRFIQRNRHNADYKKVYRGRNIKAYSLNWDGEYLWYRPDLMKEKTGCLPHTKEFFEVPEKLITQRVNSSMQLLVAYDNEKNYFLDTTNVSRYESWDKNYSMKYLCGILNSSTINFWYSRNFRMPTIGGYELESIPIVDANKITQTKIIEIVDEIVALNKQNPMSDTSILERKIDVCVYLLYGLTWNEVMVVENASNQKPMPINEAAYNQWLARYQKENILPDENEMNETLCCILKP